MTTDSPTLTLLRRALMAILVIGIVGTEAELLLLKHTDGVWQLIPIVLNGLAIIALVWLGVARNAAALRSLQGVMVLFLVSGGVGLVQHFIGNIGYARDSNPSLAGMELFRDAVMGSTPTLAPGTMVQMALVGFTFAFRHPLLTRRTNA